MPISVKRGTNKTFKFQRKLTDGTVIITVPEEIYFTVKKSCCNEDELFQKTLSAGEIVFNPNDNYYRFEILPEDTEGLIFGDYEYDIKVIELVSGETKKKNLIVDKFMVDHVVTYACNECSESEG